MASLAALISLPRFSASSRSGRNSFMHSSGGPPCVRRRRKGAAARSRPPETKPAPAHVDRKRGSRWRCADRPDTGGNAGSLRGSLARHRWKAGSLAVTGLDPAAAPETRLAPRPDRREAVTDGHGKRHDQAADDQSCSSGKVQIAPSAFPTGKRLPVGFLRFLPVVNNPWNLATARRSAAPEPVIIGVISHPLG